MPRKSKPNWVAVACGPPGLWPSRAHFCHGLRTDAGLVWAPALVLNLSKMRSHFSRCCGGCEAGKKGDALWLRGFGGILAPTCWIPCVTCTSTVPSQVCFCAARHPGAGEKQEPGVFHLNHCLRKEKRKENYPQHPQGDRALHWGNKREAPASCHPLPAPLPSRPHCHLFPVCLLMRSEVGAFSVVPRPPPGRFQVKEHRSRHAVTTVRGTNNSGEVNSRGWWPY